MNGLTRRTFCAALASAPLAVPAAARRPNVLLVMTDDQGFGDLSIHGNPHLKTPNMDSIATAGAQFTQFQVCPVCSPTRSSLMTGRYNYRTGILDTFLGRSMMHPDEVTVAQPLAAAGYRTGIFGKWHLGDNYPLRAIEHGFQEALVIKGGGLGQPSDPPESKGSYFDPILQHNGKAERQQGYCTDIFFNAATRFIEDSRNRPFFVYLPTNAPHGPLQIAENWVEPFRKAGLDENTARVYGMVANLDFNLGRLLERLKALDLERDTIVIFLSDNGMAGKRYNYGMRGTKGTVYQGGIRAPFFVRWPGVVQPGRKVDRIAAHIDVFPTLLEACGVQPPGGRKIDGRSLMPLLRGNSANWADRTLYTQWHRGDEPVLYRSCAARTQRYKLVDGKELYDMEADPAEAHDVSDAHPDVVARMRKGYEEWFRDVGSQGYAPPRIYIGTKFENPVILTRQDWRGPQAGWGSKSLGYWEVDVREAASYRIRVQMPPVAADGQVEFRLNGATQKTAVKQGATECTLDPVKVPKGPGRLEAEIQAGGQTLGVSYVYVTQV